MRLPYELLSSLANCLLNETIFEIVKGLLEIQHVTEQHLYQQRLQFIHQKKSMYIMPIILELEDVLFYRILKDRSSPGTPLVFFV